MGMNKVIYFNNDEQNNDCCCGNIYFDFIDYAFAETDYFMLVYVNYYGKGYTQIMKSFKKALEPYKVKSRSNPSWPGTLKTICPNTTYKVVFYKNDSRAKEIIKQVSRMSEWSCPLYPQDLAFFKGNQCWFYSVGHEKIAAIIHASEKDIDFVERKGLSDRKDAYTEEGHFFDSFDEILI